MRTQDLIRYGVDPRLIDVWRAIGVETLFPVQRIAVEHHDLIGGESLIVSAPASSGKSFLGEMAAAHAAVQGGKCLVLMPREDAAVETSETFRQRYEPLGARVAVSTRACRRFDSAIAAGEFNIAVVGYEKMQQLLAKAPCMPDQVQLVVADGLEAASDPRRGAGIEMLLTHLRLSSEALRLVGLCKPIGNGETLTRWLGGRLLEHAERPVELRRGILCRGTFEYETHNTRERGTEKFLPLDGSLPPSEAVLASAVWLAGKGEPSLVFLPDQGLARATALRAAERLQGPAVTEAIADLEGLEETQSRQMLVACLRGGAAFHDAGLSPEERQAVERHFGAGSIRILCATPVPALGGRLCARNVFVMPTVWDRSRRTGRPVQRPLTRAEYESVAGWAGRPGLPDGFGRCIPAAATEAERRRHEAVYLRAGAEDLVPQSKEAHLDTHIVNLVAAGAARTTGEIVGFIERTLTGVVQERELRRHKEAFRRRVTGAVSRCVERGLLRVLKRTRKLWETPLGSACAAKGLAAGTACELNAWLASLNGRSFSEAEALYVVCRAAEAREQHVALSAEEYHSRAYPEELAALLPPAAKEFLGKVVEDRAFQTYEEVEPMKTALLLHAWVHGWPVVQIEERYHVLAGDLRVAASTCAWLADAAAARPAARVHRRRPRGPGAGTRPGTAPAVFCPRSREGYAGGLCRGSLAAAGR